MAETTNINWADATINFWIGCTKVSPACNHCYAEVYGKRFGVVWGSGQERRRTVKNLAKARRLQRQAVAEGRPIYCFSNSLSDIFDNEVPIEWLADAFDIMRWTPDVIYLLLTKRPQNIVKRFCEATGQLYDQHGILAPSGWPPNVAIGCTVVNQAEFDRDVGWLAFARKQLRPAFVFLSIEPMLGAIFMGTRIHDIDEVIAGGESDQGGANARPVDDEWFRSLRDQCAAASKAFHLKQWGEWVPAGHESITDATENLPTARVDGRLMVKVGKERAGRLLDGVEHNTSRVAAA